MASAQAELAPNARSGASTQAPVGAQNSVREIGSSERYDKTARARALRRSCSYLPRIVERPPLPPAQLTTRPVPGGC